MTHYVSLGNGKENYGSTPGILITNLGSPQAPTPSAVRRYLSEFLHDQSDDPTNPMDLVPHFTWLYLRVRPRQSAHAYASIWTEQGSPTDRSHPSDRQQVLPNNYADNAMLLLACATVNPQCVTPSMIYVT